MNKYQALLPCGKAIEIEADFYRYDSTYIIFYKYEGDILQYEKTVALLRKASILDVEENGED